MKYLALKDKKRFKFICISRTAEEFKDKVDESYRLRSGLKPKGEEYTMDDYLSGFIQVEIDLKSIKVLGD